MRTETSLLVDQIFEQSNVVQMMYEAQSKDEKELDAAQENLSKLWKELEDSLQSS